MMTSSIGRQKTQKSIQGGYMPSTINKAKLESILDPNEAVSIEGYIQNIDGVLKTAKQAVLQLAEENTIFSVASASGYLYSAYTDGTDSFIARYSDSKELLHTFTGRTDKIFLKSLNEYIYAAHNSQIYVHNSLYKILEYNASSGAFTNEMEVTGVTSSETITIKKLASFVFTFEGNDLTVGEVFNDGGSNSATVSAIHNFYEMPESPERVSFFDFYQAADGGGEYLVCSSQSRIMWSHMNDDITKIPFFDWTQPATPAPQDAYERIYDSGGAHTSLATVGNVIAVGAEKGSLIFKITSIIVGTDLQQDNQTIEQSTVGMKNLFSIDGRIFYTAGKEWWNASVSNNGLSISRKPITKVFQDYKKEAFNFDEAVHFYDEDNSIIYIAFKRDSSKNNYMLGYNVQDGTLKEYPYTYLNAAIVHEEELWGAGSLNGGIVKIFGGYENNGDNVRTRVLMGKEEGLFNLHRISLEGKLSGLTELEITIHTWDRNGKQKTPKAFLWGDVGELRMNNNRLSEVQVSPISDVLETNLAYGRLFCKNISKYQIEVKTSGFSVHELHSIVIEYSQGSLQRKGTKISLSS